LLYVSLAEREWPRRSRLDCPPFGDVRRLWRCRNPVVLNKPGVFGMFPMNCDLDRNFAASWGLKRFQTDVSALISELTPLSYFFSEGYLVRRGFPSVQRTWRGDIPAHRRKCRERWLWSEKPVARAISDNGACVSLSMCSTCSKRRRNRYVCGGTPTDWWNARAKWSVESPARAASPSSRIFSSRCPSI
jgi:hypothetical protein